MTERPVQREAAEYKGKWYRDPSLLIAALALVVSVSTFIFGQLNLKADRKIQARNQLSTLISELPAVIAQNAQNPNSYAKYSLDLVAGSAATLIDQLGVEASTPSEKSVVAEVLVSRFDLARARRLAIAAEQQSTVPAEKMFAMNILASIDFRTGDAASGRDEYRQAIKIAQTPQEELDSPAARDVLTVDEEEAWIPNEVLFAKNCQEATGQLKNAKQIINRSQPQVVSPQRTALDNVSKTVAANCPTPVQ